MLHVRDATPDDADALAAAHLEGWRSGYRGVVPDSFLDSPEFAADRRAVWHAWRWNANGRSACFAAEWHGRVVGFVLCGPERAAPVCDQGGTAAGGTGRGEIYAFYLHPDAWGSGAAAALMTRSADWLHAEGYQEAVLWVLRDNPRGRAFYEKTGWSPTGREQEFSPRTTDGEPFSLVEVEYAAMLG